MVGSQDTTAQDPVVVYASLRGLLGAVAAPLVLLVLGVAALAGDPAHRVVPLVLVGAGVGLGAVVAFDYPRCSRFDASGVTRVCLLRSHQLPWSRIAAIERTHRGTLARARRLTAPRGEPAPVAGGLVVRGAGRGRWLLTDRVETAADHDRLRRLLTALGQPAPLHAQRPGDTTPPSWLARAGGRGGCR